MNISLVNASRKLGKTQVLDQVSLQIPPGQITAVIGNNGAGKTSLLRALAGHLVLDSGELRYGDASFSRENIEMRRSIMALFEAPGATKKEFSAIKLIIAALDAYERAEMLDDSLFKRFAREFEIVEKLQSSLSRLSRGERYRFYLAPLFLSGCHTLLIDEPFAAGLDQPATEMLRNWLREHAAQGGSIVYTTQLPELVTGFAHSIITVESGTATIEGGKV